jgi:type IV pilus assembly protein PilQ
MTKQRRISIPKFIGGLTVLVVMVATAWAEDTRLTDVTVGSRDDATTVTVKMSAAPKYHAALIDPRRLVIDFEDTQYEWKKTPQPGTTDPIKEIRGSQFKKGVSRLVVQLARPARYVVEENADGLVILLESKTANGTPAPRTASTAPAAAKAAPAPAPADPPARVAAAAPAESTPVPVVTPPPAPTPAPAAPTTRTPSTTRRPQATAKADPPAAAKEKAAEKASVVVAQAPTPPPAAPPGPPAGRVTSTNGRRLISLDFKDADVVNLLRILAAESGRNIVVGEDVKGKMSISLRNVPWEQALDTILETRALQKIEKDNVLRIVTAERLTQERELAARVAEAKIKSEADARAKLAEAQLKEAEALARKHAAETAIKEAEARGPLREETIRLSYADPNEVADTLIGILGLGTTGSSLQPCGTATFGGGASQTPTGPQATAAGAAAAAGPPPIAEPPFSQMYGQAQQAQGGAGASGQSSATARGLTIRSHCPTHPLFLRLYQADLERIKKLIRESFDIPLPQVKIEARMEVLDRNALEQIGIQWGGLGVGRAGSLALVGQGMQTTQVSGQTVPFIPGFVQGTSTVIDPTSVFGLTTANHSLLLQNSTALSQLGGLPISFQTGLPLGGNLINLPISALPNAGPLPASGLAFGIVAQRFNVNLALQALSEQGKTRTLARPEIVTVENNKAVMSLGEEIPYATVSSAGTSIQFKEALLKLEVTPTVIREGDVNNIKMIVVVENNSRGTVVNLGNSGQPPAINKRKTETQVLVREGQRLVIGGVSTATDSNTVRKVPLFGDIPMIGWLFKQRENFESGRELVVFITPTVLRQPDGSMPQIPARTK